VKEITMFAKVAIDPETANLLIGVLIGGVACQLLYVVGWGYWYWYVPSRRRRRKDQKER